MDNDCRFSILIPAYNEEQFIAATINSVHRSFSEIGWDSYEIVVCDNNSTDHTAEIARRGWCLNRTIRSLGREMRPRRPRAVSGSFFLDADTLLNQATLRATTVALESGRAGAGGSVVRLDSDGVSTGGRVLVQTWNAISRTLKLAAGSFVFCRRDAWLETGGFDERLYVSEEIWFSQNLKRWCRGNGLKFTILSTAPIITSARKLHWYSPWQLARQFVVFLIPGAWRKREMCPTWYARPVPGEDE